MKANYFEPEMEIVEFESADVIATSMSNETDPIGETQNP